MKSQINHDEPKYCMFCEKATVISDKSNVLCEKRGIVNCEYSCKKFIYDPLKRIPKPQPPLPKIEREDMVL